MSEAETLSAHGVLTEPATVRLERMLPGPIDRIWAYLTQSELRGQWLATGEMDLRVGGEVELVWRNDELTGLNETRPDGFEAEHRQTCVITRLEPPRVLAFTWQGDSEVTFELEPQGDEVRLVVHHRRLPNRSALLGVSAGWHAHLDVLDARARGRPVQPFWPNWTRLRAEYDSRLPA